MKNKTKLSKKTSYNEQSLYAYCSCSCGDCGCPGFLTTGDFSATSNASMPSASGWGGRKDGAK